MTSLLPAAVACFTSLEEEDEHGEMVNSRVAKAEVQIEGVRR